MVGKGEVKGRKREKKWKLKRNGGVHIQYKYIVFRALVSNFKALFNKAQKKKKRITGHN